MAIYADKCKSDVWHLGKWKNDKPDEKLRIQRTCKIKSKGFKTTMEEIKQNQIISSDTHIEKKHFERKGLLSINRKCYFSPLTGGDKDYDQPNLEESTKFWSEIERVPIAHT